MTGGDAANATGAPISQVARRAGVSITTVSRVLSPSGHKVSAKTQALVHAAAQQLNYAPSPLAQALAKGTSRIVGILVGDNDDPHFAGIIRGAEEVANRAGYLIIVGNTERRSEHELRYVRMLRGYRADGIIFIGGGIEDEAGQRELAAQVCAFQKEGGVVVVTTQHRLTALRVSVDSEAAAGMAVQHLLDLGHTRIGLVAGPATVLVSQARTAGVRRSLASRGLTLSHQLVAEGDLTCVGGEHAAGTLLDLAQDQRPTAIFAANDLMAIGVLAAARSRRIAVPGDLSVVGLGDIPLAGSVWPPLTTIHFPLRDLGAAAMELVLDGLRADGPPSAPASQPGSRQDGSHSYAKLAARVLPAHLVIRESTAPPARQQHTIPSRGHQ